MHLFHADARYGIIKQHGFVHLKIILWVMEMNKRLCQITVLVLIPFMMTACSVGSGDASKSNANYEKSVTLEEFLLGEGIALTCEMGELAGNDEYVDLLVGGGSVRNMIDEIASQDYSMPGDIHMIKLSDDIVRRVIMANSGGTPVSDSLMDKLRLRINASLVGNLINARQGVEAVAAASVMTWSKSYIAPDNWSDNRLLILEYPGKFSSVVSFVQTGDGVITGTAAFVRNDEQGALATLNELMGTAEQEYDHYSSEQLQKLLGK